MTGQPAETLRRAAALLAEHAGAVEAEMADPGNRYWGGTGSDRYRTGVRSGLGGASGELAALFTPDAARSLAGWLEEVASDRHATLPAWVEAAALTVARACLGEVPA